MDEKMNSFESLIKGWENRGFAAFSPEEIKTVYASSYELYRSQKYDEAAQLFRFLTVLAPFEANYWKGLGASLQMKGQYNEALSCYICCQILNHEQPDPHLYVYAADCYFALDQREQGLKALEAARLSAEEKDDEQVIHHVSLMKELWSNTDKKGH